MAACESPQHIFETPLPAESPRLVEPLPSWNQLPPVKPSHRSSFTEIFGELHFVDDSPVTSSPSSLPLESKCVSSSSLLDLAPQPNTTDNENEETACDKSSSMTSRASISSIENKYNTSHQRSDSLSSINSESLHLCTKGLSFESSGDVEDTRTTTVENEEWGNVSFTTKPCFMATTSDSHFRGHRKTRSASLGGFPPLISCMSKSGKPWVCFKSYRHDGRFVLKEIRVPSQEFLHAYREGGRLKMQLIHQDNEHVLSEVEREDDDDDGAASNEEENSNDDGEDDPEENGDEHADVASAVNDEANNRTCNTNQV